jgi:hypothetical protein
MDRGGVEVNDAGTRENTKVGSGMEAAKSAAVVPLSGVAGLLASSLTAA